MRRYSWILMRAGFSPQKVQEMLPAPTATTFTFGLLTLQITRLYLVIVPPCTNTWLRKCLPSPICVVPDLRTCCCCMYLRVGRVLELSWDKSFPESLWQALSALAMAPFIPLAPSVRTTSCAVCFQNVSSLNTHGLRHGKDRLIALGCCDSCKSDSRVYRMWAR